MRTFSIKDIESVSGIKCHTLRIWEQRYGIFSPKRTNTNIRYYDDDDLKRVINISILNKYGYKISEISKMSENEIINAIKKFSLNENEFDTQIKKSIQYIITFDEVSFKKILSENIFQIGFEKVMTSFVFPLLKEIGMLWQLGSLNPVHEHFATNIITQKLYVAVDSCNEISSTNKKRFLLFLPDNEQHSIGLLFANYVLRSRGFEVIYLGQEVPFDDILQSFGGNDPDYIFTILTSSITKIDKQKFVNSISEFWKNSTILLSGFQFLLGDFNLRDNTKIIYSAGEFIDFANSLSKKF